MGRLEEMGERAFVSTLAALLGEVLYRRGRHTEAARFVERSVETAAPDDLVAQIAWRTVQAKLLAIAGHMENAETLARRAVSLAEKTDWSNDHAAACIALGEVLHKRGLSEQAQTVVRKALDLYEAKGNIVAVEGVRALQARLVLA